MRHLFPVLPAIIHTRHSSFPVVIAENTSRLVGYEVMPRAILLEHRNARDLSSHRCGARRPITARYICFSEAALVKMRRSFEIIPALETLTEYSLQQTHDAHF